MYWLVVISQIFYGKFQEMTSSQDIKKCILDVILNGIDFMSEEVMAKALTSAGISAKEVEEYVGRTLDKKIEERSTLIDKACDTTVKYKSVVERGQKILDAGVNDFIIEHDIRMQIEELQREIVWLEKITMETMEEKTKLSVKKQALERLLLLLQNEKINGVIDNDKRPEKETSDNLDEI